MIATTLLLLVYNSSTNYSEMNTSTIPLQQYLYYINCALLSACDITEAGARLEQAGSYRGHVRPALASAGALDPPDRRGDP